MFTEFACGFAEFEDAEAKHPGCSLPAHRQGLV
jgi:hypothetical protein